MCPQGIGALTAAWRAAPPPQPGTPWGLGRGPPVPWALSCGGRGQCAVCGTWLPCRRCRADVLRHLSV
eukprot:8763915-Lingulodinium_polyedra.AAC.1